MDMLRRMLTERDYVLRLAKQLAEAIARALKLARTTQGDAALVSLREACSSALGMEYQVLSMLDARSAVELLGAPERVQAFVELVEAMGDVDDAAEPLRALGRYRHALELIDAAVERGRVTTALAALRSRIEAKSSR